MTVPTTKQDQLRALREARASKEPIEAVKAKVTAIKAKPPKKKKRKGKGTGRLATG